MLEKFSQIRFSWAVARTRDVVDFPVAKWHRHLISKTTLEREGGTLHRRACVMHAALVSMKVTSVEIKRRADKEFSEAC